MTILLSCFLILVLRPEVVLISLVILFMFYQEMLKPVQHDAPLYLLLY